MARIELCNLVKSFGAVQAVKDLSFTIEDGEFVVFVGPSGCGKTTTLRMIAGFEDPSSGEIRIDGQTVNDLEPRDRGLGMVFQSHALFPHKNVAQNIEFGLRMKKVEPEERVRRVREVAEMVRITHLLQKMPGQCSGGESQRVALARTLVTNPSTFLLDEPLSSLDAKLRRELRAECDRLHQELRRTFIYVTHDQEEALAMSDRLAVFSHGVIEQVGAPAEVYERPATAFVAGFVGTSNLLSGDAARAIVGHDGTFTVRPEKIRLEAPDAPVAADESSALGHVDEVVYLGSDTRYLVALELGPRLVVTEQNLATSSTQALAARGRAVRLTWKREHNYPVKGGVSVEPAGPAETPTAETPAAAKEEDRA